MDTSDNRPDAAWYECVSKGGSLVYFILRVNPDVVFEFLTDAVEHQLGCPAADGLADPAAVLGRIDDSHAGRLAETLALRPGSATTVELTWHHRDGRPIYSRTWVQCRQRPDGSVVLDGVTRDITQLRETEADLKTSQERYRLLAENAWEVIWTAAPDGTITYISPSVERVRGFTPAEAMSLSITQTHPPATAASVLDFYRRLFDAAGSGTELPVFRGEQEYYRKDGSIMVGEVQVIPQLDADGRLVEILGVTRDISERKEFEAELRRLAVYDPVTGVWNRRHGEELMVADLEQARDSRQRLTVLMLDIDHFKLINDTHGHQAGDRVLAEICRRVLDTVDTTAVVARWGGEEFVVMLRNCGADDALNMAEKIRARIADSPFGAVASVTVSIGVAELTDADDLTSWLARADQALYRAKRSGRNRCEAS
ncbi:sensor domain-containing diguanylate cyclase [Mycobacterium sp. EPa45]|uniref:sensor domain-containing diguanylate cyclase n=1 Tax=Mycobacterium sp. EPa45 TaxID=1545728 RepID=UPI00069996FE|nr:sensor domain-containing diguanylate cyclase [Mycobacterium sp. EPa45]